MLLLVLVSLALFLSVRVFADELSLTQTDMRYPLASLNHSIGFVPADEGVALQNAPLVPPQFSAAGINPDFNLHRRYWLYIGVVNNTAESEWVVHISNFGFKQPAILVRGDDGQYAEVLQNANANAGINSIGRAVHLRLEPGKRYTLIAELTAHHRVWDPYIALMSRQEYVLWNATMDVTYKVAIGVILGMILLAFLCWALMAEATFLWAGLSSLLLLLYYLEHSSLAALFWNSGFEKNQLFWTLVSMVLLSLLMFAASFLQVNRRSGYLYRVFVFTAAVTLLVFAIGPLLSFPLRSFLYAGNYLLLWVVILGSGIAKVRSEGRYYIIYILGWLPLVLSVVEVILFIFLSRQSEQEVDVSYQMIQVLYIQILHMMIHAVALMLRVRAMRQQKLMAEFASQAKSMFIAQSSHDLHQPLHAMQIFLESLKPYVQHPDAKPLWTGLAKTRQQMSDSFVAIMDLSRLESGVIKPEINVTQLNDIFARLQHDFAPQANEKQIRLRLHPCSVAVLTDPLLLERMLRNLIANAIKYTSSGRVVVGCRRRGNAIVIQVLDSGAGIAAGNLDRIFDIYHRANIQNPDGYSQGIGLSIVKHLSLLLDHPVKVASTPGRGSLFSVQLPRAVDIQESAEHQLTALQHTHIQQNRPVQVALLIHNAETRGKVLDALSRWNITVRLLNKGEDIVAGVAAVQVLIIDQPAQQSLSSGDGALGNTSLTVACVCTNGTALPEHWVALSDAVYPSQLRALINYAQRKQAPA
ncbi:sensor histidine kinase [Thalassolituus sp. LLYu03]|uniref:sensor histidine kinase n=1 Tax=Thalassolituus sp. LLYu03 TaxID=3421656 RepID=UPI003D26CBEA